MVEIEKLNQINNAYIYKINGIIKISKLDQIIEMILIAKKLKLQMKNWNSNKFKFKDIK